MRRYGAEPEMLGRDDDYDCSRGGGTSVSVYEKERAYESARQNTIKCKFYDCDVSDGGAPFF